MVEKFMDEISRLERFTVQKSENKKNLLVLGVNGS
jgi:hypothetical protein